MCRRAADGEPAGTPQPVTARSSHAAVALDQQLLLLGGQNSGSLLGEACIADAGGVQVRARAPSRPPEAGALAGLHADHAAAAPPP